ncbi:hypothetical protein CLOP_g13229 [Closterium sp. NIES-67]|nr:hypothetical protein CLOP_g13229 [Closterium sp. NIES-67]
MQCHFRLKVVNWEDLDTSASTHPDDVARGSTVSASRAVARPLSELAGRQCGVHPSDWAAIRDTWQQAEAEGLGGNLNARGRRAMGKGAAGGGIMKGGAGGSDGVLAVIPHPGVPPAAMALSAVHRFNLHLASDIRYEFEVFVPPPRFALQDLCDQLHRLFHHQVLTVSHTLVMSARGKELAVRVAEANNLSEDERDEAVLYHCYRGMLTNDTQIHLVPDTGIELANWTPKQAATSPGPSKVVNLLSSDDELFPVKKALLRPCLALTKAVQDTGPEPPTVQVGVECLLLDRVLLFLEADFKGEAESFQFDINLTQELREAAACLKLKSLADLCDQRLGLFESRIREYSFAEVAERNASGNCWLLLDGMVLDVTRWLPEHPGGDTIIPTQGLNRDCTVFFELYHSSRESFLYLRHFYMGELKEEDKVKLAEQEDQQPSAEFMQQLWEYTHSFRLHGTTIRNL